MTIRILVNGASGKMGQASVKAVQAESDLLLVGEAGKNHDLAAEIKKTNPDIVIDFTIATASLDNAHTILDAGVRPIIGTSGLKEKEVEDLQKKANTLKLGGLIAPNFSIGVVLMMKYAQQIIQYYPQAEIIEMHHDGKLDAPSGTAIRTAELMAKHRKTTPTEKIEKHLLAGSRGANHHHIPIHAIRLPGLIAKQQVIFGGLGETFTLEHNTLDRQCFMPGVILACRKVMTINHLVYGLEHFI